MMIGAVLFLAGCLGGGGAEKVSAEPPEAVVEDVLSLELSPSEVLLMVGGEVVHDFVLRLKEPAPDYIALRQEDETAEVKVRTVPDKIQVTNGEARGQLIFAEPPSYLVGDQTAGLLVTDTQGNILAKVAVDVYVLPPGAS
jgi:hypothetical protein